MEVRFDQQRLNKGVDLNYLKRKLNIFYPNFHLADHLLTDGTVSRVTAEGAGVGAAARAGLTAAHLTLLTLQKGEGSQSQGEREGGREGGEGGREIHFFFIIF